MLIPNPQGHYHFLKGIDPYSCGVIADPGYEIYRATLREPVSWTHGFDRVDEWLESEDRDRSALCGIELRCPSPYSILGFKTFNQKYCEMLKEWDLYVGDLNPIARTNVAPSYSPPLETTLHAFSYTVRAEGESDLTLVVAGAGELRDGILEEANLIRRGETDDDAMREKASYVMKVMEERMIALGGRWDMLNSINVYTVHPIDDLAQDVILNRVGPARRHGIHWYHSRPPIHEIEFEMDMHAVGRELII